MALFQEKEVLRDLTTASASALPAESHAGRYDQALYRQKGLLRQGFSPVLAFPAAAGEVGRSGLGMT
jgi:hypothetical protein